MKVLTIAGSPLPISRSGAVLTFASGLLRQRGLSTEHVSVRDLPADDLLLGRFDSLALKPTFSKLNAAQAVLVATPVYKASFAGTLKAFLDLWPENALVGKVVLPFATAGSSAHLLAVDYALKPVLPSCAGPGPSERAVGLRNSLQEKIMTIQAINVRNQFRGKIKEIIFGSVVSEIDVETPHGIVTSVITTRSVTELGLKVGSEVIALVKSTEVSIAKI